MGLGVDPYYCARACIVPLTTTLTRVPPGSGTRYPWLPQVFCACRMPRPPVYLLLLCYPSAWFSSRVCASALVPGMGASAGWQMLSVQPATAAYRYFLCAYRGRATWHRLRCSAA